MSNPITGDRLTTGHVSDDFRANFDRIFKKAVGCDKHDFCLNGEAADRMSAEFQCRVCGFTKEITCKDETSE